MRVCRSVAEVPLSINIARAVCCRTLLFKDRICHGACSHGSFIVLALDEWTWRLLRPKPKEVICSPVSLQRPLTQTHLFSSPFHFSVPCYQRPYSWTTVEAGQLLQDLLAAAGIGGVTDAAEPDYFLGTILLLDGSGGDLPAARDREPRMFEIIDGQQRLVNPGGACGCSAGPWDRALALGVRAIVSTNSSAADAGALRQFGARLPHRGERRPSKRSSRNHIQARRGVPGECRPRTTERGRGSPAHGARSFRERAVGAR